MSPSDLGECVVGGCMGESMCAWQIQGVCGGVRGVYGRFGVFVAILGCVRLSRYV